MKLTMYSLQGGAVIGNAANRKGNPFFLFAPAILSIFLYFNIIGNTFNFDDYRYIVENPCVKGEVDFGEAMTRDVWCIDDENASTGSWRPVLVTLYRVIYAFFSNSPTAYHIANIIFHALLVLMATLFAMTVTKNPQIAIITGLLFAAHPVHTEAVNSVGGMGDLLAGIFAFVALMIYTYPLHHPKSVGARWAAIPVVIFALFIKETVIAVFALFFLLDLFLIKKRPEGRIFTRRPDRKFAFDLLAPWIIAALLLSLYLWMKQTVFGQVFPIVHVNDNPLAGQPNNIYYPTALQALYEYLKLLVWPTSLSVDYSFNQIPLIDSLFHPKALIALLAVILMALLGVVAFFINLPLAIALFFILATLSLSSNLIITIPTILAERHLVLPSFGVCFIGGQLLGRYWPRSSQANARRIMTVVLMVILALMSWRVMTRNVDWATNLSLFQKAVEVTPNSWKNQVNYGHYLKLSEQYEEAISAYEKAVLIDSERKKAWINKEIGYCLHKQGDYQKALLYYNRAHNAEPSNKKIRKLKALAEEKKPAP